MDSIKAGGFKLSKQQRSAFENIVEFVDREGFNSNKIYLLSGYSGTGKTTIVKYLRDHFKHETIAYTAPTNKATKVIKKILGKDAECRTIFSLLGIKMVADEDLKKLEFPRIPSDLSDFDIIFVDEISMVNEALYDYIKLRSHSYTAKWIFLGDKAQIPPVGEIKSKVWLDSLPKSSLTKVMRHDNQILNLATHIRKQIRAYPKLDLRLKSDHDASQGVWKYKPNKFKEYIAKAAKQGLFTELDNTKVIAWRNEKVREYNGIVRQNIFGSIAEAEQWLVSDRVLIASPVEYQGAVIAHIDDEGTIVGSEVTYHSIYREFDCYILKVKLDDSKLLVLNVIHPNSVESFNQRLSDLALDAKKDRTKWKHFWALKTSFNMLRHSYCITAHRGQGSTFVNTFVDSRDILDNPSTIEALQCLYVACTRPTTRLILL